MRTLWKRFVRSTSSSITGSLNDVEGLANPTSENLAIWIWERVSTSLRGLSRVVVRRRLLRDMSTGARGANELSRGVRTLMPAAELLETFPNPYPGREYEIAMECPEFTSLCPLGGIESDAAELALLEGGAPDFGTIHITYVPGDVCVELKSLKLYLWSFRNDGIFYERAVNRILDDLVAAVKPRGWKSWATSTSAAASRA